MSDYRWLTNLRFPFSPSDSAYLAKLSEYKVGAPIQPKDRETAYTLQQLNDFNVVGIYTTAHALAATGGEAFTVAKAREQLGDEHTLLESHLSDYLDDDFHLVAR